MSSSSSSSALLLVDGQGKVVFVDPRRKLFNVIALGPVHRIVQLNSSSSYAGASRHSRCNHHNHKEHGGDEGEHPNYIPPSSSSPASVIRRMDNVFLFLCIHNRTCDSHEQLVNIFRKTQLLQQYKIHSEDSMAVEHSQLWIPIELQRPSDNIMIATADDDEDIVGSPSIRPSYTEEQSGKRRMTMMTRTMMASLSIRLPPLESNAMLIHIDTLSSLYLQSNGDFFFSHLPVLPFLMRPNRYFLSNRKSLQTSIFEATLHALIRLSKKMSSSSSTTQQQATASPMPTRIADESEGGGDSNASAARLSIAICTSDDDNGYSCWRDDDNGSSQHCCYTEEDTSLMQRVLKEVLQLKLLCCTRGRRSYSASFLSYLELSTKQMIESSQRRSSKASLPYHHRQHHRQHHHHLGIPSYDGIDEGMQRYVDFTRHWSSLDPLLLCELVSRLGRKLEPSTSKLLFPIHIGRVRV